MNNPNNLFSMMQTGGMTSTAGGAALARALQRQSDTKKLERQARAEARRQKRGSTFGSILGTVGGLLGGAIGGTAGAAIGSGLGNRIGEGIGAGKTKKYDTSGTVFGQEAFRDVQRASRDYTRGMGERALVSGLQAGLSAGLTPGGGMYGQYNPFTSVGRQGIGAGLQGLGVTGYTPTQSLFSFGRAQYEGGTGGLPATGQLTLLDKARRSLFSGRSLYNLEDGGLAGYQNGGYTASGILQQAGLAPTEEQLKLFQQYDPSKIQEFQSSLQQNLLSGTRQAQQQSAGMGFAGSGAVQQTQSQQREMAASDLQRAQEASQRAFESQTLGTAADLLAGGAEILGADGGLTGTFVTELPTSNQGRVTMSGQNYIWSEEEGQYILET